MLETIYTKSVAGGSVLTEGRVTIVGYGDQRPAQARSDRPAETGARLRRPSAGLQSRPESKAA